MTWLGRIVMEPKTDGADHLVVEKGMVGRRHAEELLEVSRVTVEIAQAAQT